MEIIKDIVELAQEGIKKTHIMYRANLSYDQIVSYLDEVTTKGLVAQAVRDGMTVYVTTDKGREFIGCYNKMAAFLEEPIPVVA